MSERDIRKGFDVDLIRGIGINLTTVRVQIAGLPPHPDLQAAQAAIQRAQDALARTIASLS